jgi:hypothetical protein
MLLLAGCDASFMSFAGHIMCECRDGGTAPMRCSACCTNKMSLFSELRLLHRFEIIRECGAACSAFTNHPQRCNLHTVL